MGGIQDRMDSAEMNVLVPQCKMCRNVIFHEFNGAHPMDPTMTCKSLGKIPRDILLAKAHNCPRYIADEEKVKIFKPFFKD